MPRTIPLRPLQLTPAEMWKLRRMIEEYAVDPAAFAARYFRRPPAPPRKQRKRRAAGA